jgi:choline dehydrogenase-like flavoprotein
MAQSFDYVIAGGGAAGCVLAARLSAGNAKVLLIEAGPPDNHPFIHMPAGFTKLSGPRVNWGLSDGSAKAPEQSRYVVPARTHVGRRQLNQRNDLHERA